MNDWKSTANSTIYKEALKATETLEDTACGFAKPKDLNGVFSSALIKQNNTIIQLLVKIKEDLEDCKTGLNECRTAIKRIEAAKTPAVETGDLSNTIEELQKGLKNLKLGEHTPRKAPKARGQFFVFKDPKEIFEAEKQNESN